MNNYESFTDQQLIALMKQGDHPAFNEIYKRHSPKVFYQVNQMLRDRDAAKDLVQELFIAVWTKAINIKEDTKLGGYLYIAAQNRVFKLIQQGKLKNDYLQSLSEFTSQMNFATNEAVGEKELQTLIDLEIAKLPPKMKQVFELSRKENLSYHEIAQQLDISDNTVRKQVSNALKILRDKLAPHAPEAMIFIALLRRE